jgi:ABC-2 type transport system permease protein
MSADRAGPSGQGASAGVIHNIGYQAYQGARLGRARIVRALCWYSLRGAFGIGRSGKAKIVPLITFALICLPAIIDAVAIALSHSHARQISYDTYVPALRTLVLIVFIAAQAPELVSRDLRSHCLPLYFARPIERIDYPLAKLAAFFLALLAMIEIPLLLLYLGTVVQLPSGSAIWHETGALIPGLAIGLAWAVLLAALGLLFACLSGRRAYATGAVAIFFLLTLTLATLLVQIGEAPGSGGDGGLAVARIAGLISPFTVLDGLRQWLGSTANGLVPKPGGLGPVYGLMFVAFLAVGIGGLIVRYRKVGVA